MVNTLNLLSMKLLYSWSSY